MEDNKLLMPIMFEDEKGNRFEATTDKEFDEYMGRDDLHLVFE